MLSSLLELHLSSCQLNYFPSLPYLNFTALEVLDLSFNYFESPLLDWFSSLNNLLSLDLGYNSFCSPIPLHNLTLLRVLDLSINWFNSTIPNWLNSFKHLEHLDLSYNAFNGTISAAINNQTSLASLNLNENNIEGEMPNFSRNLYRLVHLVLSYSNFKGDITGVLTSLFLCVPSSLESLWLAENKLLLGNVVSNRTREGKLRSLILQALEASERNSQFIGPIPLIDLTIPEQDHSLTNLTNPSSASQIIVHLETLEQLQTLKAHVIDFTTTQNPLDIGEYEFFYLWRNPPTLPSQSNITLWGLLTMKNILTSTMKRLVFISLAPPLLSKVYLWIWYIFMWISLQQSTL
ncbi:hypothetical protein GIB67_023475 [Kingdonia uniflora]|uniref:Uncharacterized protein n=1 Tax=Kingdonia uniflora TaxID=39325 RepID=A0A7J7PAL5_9MAGN|nr:hypothetical protein GIB67_023475 [Kingdonia uniflora]